MRKTTLLAAVAVAAGPAAGQDPAPVPRAAPTPQLVPSPLPPAFPVGPPVPPAAGGLTVTEPVGRTGPYAEASFLLQWISDTDTGFPLATGGPAGGVLGRPGTTRLLAADSDYDAAPGFRVTVGSQVGERFAVEGSGFLVGRVTDRREVGVTSAAVVARPFVDPTVFPAREAARVVAAPGAFAGGVTADSSARVFGFEASPVFRVSQGAGPTVDVVTGFRYLQFNETLEVFDGSRSLGPGAGFAGAGLGPGAQLVVRDRFGGTTQFYGLNLGARVGVTRGPVAVGLTGKVALGGANQRVLADGTTTLVAGGPFAQPVTTGGGFLTGGGLLEARRNGRFAVLPEGEVRVGYRVGECVTAFAGYSVLYLSTAARPADQLTRTLAPTALATSPGFSPGAPRAVAPGLVDGDLFVHGFSFGVTVAY